MTALRAKGNRWVHLFFCVVIGLGIAGCAPAPQKDSVPPISKDSPAQGESKAVRLIEVFDAANVIGTDPAATEVPPRTEWDFAEGTAPATLENDDATLGWRAMEGVSDFALTEGRLSGVSTTDLPMLNVGLPVGLLPDDMLHAIEIRMKTSAGTNVEFSFMPTEEPIVAAARDGFWAVTSALVPGDEMRTYTIPNTFSFGASAPMRQLFLRLTGAEGAKFEIESFRMIFRKEYLAAIKSGVSWQGLSEIYRETLVARAPETVRFPLTLPRSPWLDLGVGTIEEGPVTFIVELITEGGDTSRQPLLRHTVTTPQRWERLVVDLPDLGGQDATLTLSLSAPHSGAVGFWGSPVVRSRAAEQDQETPRGVIIILADTLRRDHLDAYGYDRETAPTLTAMAKEGAFFSDCIAQATWTKVSTPSIMTSLWPTSHGVTEFTDRLPSSATTLAEIYRDNGYATLAMSSVPFTGRFSNMHQGFEELHESSSVKSEKTTKNMREYVDRLLPWLESHRDAPFFVLLHVFDPHDPFEPRAPYNTLWADPGKREEHIHNEERVKEVIADPLMKLFTMPNRKELEEAEVDPDEFISYTKDWYDGAIRGMDVEVARLMEGLKDMGLHDKTLIAFTSDHGEEFLEHGAMFHGQSVYGELANIPLFLWQPKIIPGNVVVGKTVRSIDIMPTLLELSGLKAPDGIHGQSLMPLIQDPDAQGRAAIIEKAATERVGSPANREAESFAIVQDGWKLIHNTVRTDSQPEFELYDHRKDPLNLNDLAAGEPDVVERLADELAKWHETAVAAKLKSDADVAQGASAEDLEQLRSLGYLH